MSSVLVFCELSDGKLKKSSLELLSAAKNSGRKVFACALGPGADQIVPTLAGFGATDVTVNADPKLKVYNPEIWCQLVVDSIGVLKPDVVLASAGMLGRDLLPRVAARLDASLVSDCVDLKMSESLLEVRKPLFAGKCTAKVEFVNPGLKIILMRANQLPVVSAGVGEANVKTLALSEANLKTRVKDVVKGVGEKLDLTEANVIVSGGRGLQGPENFKMLEELAQVLGATVGASRAVVDAGWVPHSMQVGQTGKTVAPSLYIACGISGAIQHLAGMSGSKVIVAINKDPDAPIFQKATYGIVGDVFQIVPKLIEEFKRVIH